MNLQRLFRLWPLLLIAGAGALLIIRPGNLSPESVARQEVDSLLAPAGILVTNANTDQHSHSDAGHHPGQICLYPPA